MLLESPQGDNINPYSRTSCPAKMVKKYGGCAEKAEYVFFFFFYAIPHFCRLILGAQLAKNKI